MLYRGRLAPSPTGPLHAGHAQTFAVAHARARRRGGALILRIEDLDKPRCRPEFERGQIDDLRWLGLDWDEGPDISGPHAPYRQSERLDQYQRLFERLRADGRIYPCTCSRKDIRTALNAPHAVDDEPPYPGTCRDRTLPSAQTSATWRFRVPDGEAIRFDDALCGPQEFVAGRDFGDFPVWRRDGLPSYQLAVVADDHAMKITEVVRGADLLVSTARQLLLYRAFGWTPPAFAHAPLVLDETGARLSKRDGALSLAALRAAGTDPARLTGEALRFTDPG